MKSIKDKNGAFRRLCEVKELLMEKGKFHSTTEFATIIGEKQPNLSAALSGDHKRLTRGLLTKIADAFPTVINRQYLLEGIGNLELRDPALRPHIPATVAAGSTHVPLTVSPDEADYYDPIPHLPAYDFTITVWGDSMEPALSHGDILACSWEPRNFTPNPRNIYIFDTDEGQFVKRARLERGRLTLRSDNPDYPDIRLHPSQVYRAARVVGLLRTL